VQHPGNGTGRKVLFFADEFTNYNDAHIGIKAISLLRSLGYDPVLTALSESGRTYLSKGLLNKARILAEKNVVQVMLMANKEIPLIGIEPSAILCFRDEYPELVREQYRSTARELSQYCFTIDEFIAREFEQGNISKDAFTKEKKAISFHGHCYQKALTGTQATRCMLSIPENYHVEEIPSGCCGMAGSFGYEKEHYELSMKVGELVLFPAVRAAASETLIVAAGTSCRHHLLHGTGKQAMHPVEVLFDAFVTQ
jgi:Fe-S oxidoreductase